jgi:hypothetical protein
VKIRYRWSGRPGEGPMHEHILASARGRGGYLVLAVNNRGIREAGTPAAHELLVLSVERVSRATVLATPPGMFYGIVWDRRRRVRA